MKLKLNNVRLAFPALFEAKTVNGEGDPRFSAVFLMDPKHPQLEEVRKTLKQVEREMGREVGNHLRPAGEKAQSLPARRRRESRI